MSTVAGFPATHALLGLRELRALRVHEAAARFRPLDPNERKLLGISMTGGYDHGQPLILAASSGKLVDGRNRRDVAIELKLESVPVVRVAFPDEAAILHYVVAVNLGRRHMTFEERAKLAGRLVRLGASTREAALQAGVSKDTAQRSAAGTRKAGVSGETPTTRALDVRRALDVLVRLPSPVPEALLAALSAEQGALLSTVLDALHSEGKPAA